MMEEPSFNASRLTPLSFFSFLLSSSHTRERKVEGQHRQQRCPILFDDDEREKGFNNKHKHGTASLSSIPLTDSSLLLLLSDVLLNYQFHR